ncbi:tyrosine-type recombinase/integrase [Yersinia enterocolitica]|uniref:Putative integrase n=1 Tax=Yersinia aleksiciae TaxID=263819 RepID=A0A0T9T2U9_YERAE|nr:MULTISPECIES: site-specific integrase [Yersinia]CFQ70333.1 putative integrase [Yersinia enterocolitica]CNK58535.1 putative integrase [Yersinia aleksiciae]
MASLMLSRHGIWYYRKVNILPSGKRKEFRRSLRTRSKSEALKRIAQYQDNLIPIMMNHSPEILQLLAGLQVLHALPNQKTLSPLPPRLPNLHIELKQYLKAKEDSVSERERDIIERFVTNFLAYTNDPYSKRQAAQFIDQLPNAIPTKNMYVRKIGAFFRWIDRRTDQDIKNPFSGLSIRDTVSASEKRPAYTAEQVKQLEALIDREIEWKRWIILIARFSGMRANEICQLYCDDIQKIEDIWCFRIDTTHPLQNIKTTNSRRYVPIHAELLKKGILTYVGQQKERLFPRLSWRQDSFAVYFTAWFLKFRKRHNLPEFHSLRHYAATVLKQAGVPEQYAGALLGHSSGQGITYNRYGKGIGKIDILFETVNLL